MAVEGVHTWMEIYPATDDEFQPALARAVEGAALDRLIHGARHTEIFTELPPCA